MRQRGFVMRGKGQGVLVFQNERKTRKIRVQFQGSVSMGDEANRSFLFCLFFCSGIMLGRRQFFFLSFLNFSNVETDLEDRERHIGYKKPIQHKVHKDLRIFHSNICFLKLEKLEFKISIILGSITQNISFFFFF